MVGIEDSACPASLGFVLGDRLTVGHETLNLGILVRIHVSQPVKRRKRLGGSAFRARFTLSEAEVLRGKRVKSAFFETCGQPPEKRREKTQKF